MKILQYISHLAFLLCIDCNKHTIRQTRVGEGFEVTDSAQFPFFAQLLIPLYPTLSVGNECGGSLISPQWILTAGHCFPWESKKIDWLIKQNRKVVFMGSLQPARRNPGETVSKPVIEIHHHPKYKYKERIVDEERIMEIILNDLAIAKLTTPFRISPTIQTIKLSTTFGNYTAGILVGAGMTIINDLDTNKSINYAVLPVVDVKDLPFHLKYETKTTFYSVGIIADEGENSTGYGLYGDAGGPFIDNNTQGDAPTLVGVLSVLEYNILRGRVVHAVERVDLAIGFILKHVPYVEHRGKPTWNRTQNFKKIQAVSNGNCQKIILVLLLVLVYSANCVF